LPELEIEIFTGQTQLAHFPQHHNLQEISSIILNTEESFPFRHAQISARGQTPGNLNLPYSAWTEHHHRSESRTHPEPYDQTRHAQYMQDYIKTKRNSLGSVDGKGQNVVVSLSLHVFDWLLPKNHEQLITYFAITL
jgi:hypothetical protein